MTRSHNDGDDSPQDGDVTRLLAELTAGEKEAMGALMPIVYGELKRMAHRQLMQERSGHTLNTTALVHEAFLKLSRLDRLQWNDRSHFFAMAARAMRRILVDHAVRNNAVKRGGGARPVTLNETDLVSGSGSMSDVDALDQALERLEQVSPRGCRVVECRFFAGLTVEETGSALGISPATVKREWAVSRAWLNRELAR